MKTYNVELKFVDPEDHQYWIDLLEEQQRVFNEISKVKFDNNLSNALKLIHDKCYSMARENYPNVPSQIIIKTEQEVKQCYSSAKSNKHKIDNPIVKKKLSLRLDQRLYSNLTSNSISLISKTKNKRTKVSIILYPKVEDMFSKYIPKDPLIFERDSKLFLAISFDVPSLPLQNNKVLGIDLGIRRLATTSDGRSYLGKEYTKTKRRLRYLKRMLQKKGTKSAKRHLKKVRKKEYNYSKNYIHHLTNSILDTDKATLVLEDLTKIKEDTSKHSNGYKRTQHNNRISQIPFGMIRTILSYKAPLIGKQVVTVNPRNTSKDDCRNIEPGMRKGCRYYCSDGKIFDADWQASITIAQRYTQHPIPFELPLDGKLNFIGRLLSASLS